MGGQLTTVGYTVGITGVLIIGLVRPATSPKRGTNIMLLAILSCESAEYQRPRLLPAVSRNHASGYAREQSESRDREFGYEG